MKNWIKSFIVLSVLSAGSFYAFGRRSVLSQNRYSYRTAQLSNTRLVHNKKNLSEDKTMSQFSGDVEFFYRHSQSKGYYVRFRGGWSGKVSRHLDWGFKLATAGWNQNLTNGVYYKEVPENSRYQKLINFGPKPVWVDAIFVTYTPVENLVAALGKMSNPYFDSNRYNLIWDRDLAPEGLNVHYKKDFGQRYQLELNGSVFLMSAFTGLTESARATRLGLDKYNDLTYMTAGLARLSMSYDDYDLRSGIAYYNIQANSLSSSQDSLGTEEKYSVVDISLQMQIKKFWKPISGSIQFIQNFSVQHHEFGFVAGGKIGLNKKSWNAGYHYFVLPKDVTLGNFTDSNVGGLGTGYKGHQLNVQYFFNKSTKVGAKYILRRDDVSEKLEHLPYAFLSISI